MKQDAEDSKPKILGERKSRFPGDPDVVFVEHPQQDLISKGLCLDCKRSRKETQFSRGWLQCMECLFRSMSPIFEKADDELEPLGIFKKAEENEKT